MAGCVALKRRDIRATYQPSGVTIADSTLSNKALSLAGSGRLSAPARTDAPWIVAAKTRATLADLSILLPSLSGNANLRADLSGSIAALRTVGDMEATVAVHGSAPGTVRGTFDVAGLPHAPQAQVSLRGLLATQPVTLQALVQVHPGDSIHIELPQADWQSLHAQGDLTLGLQDLDRSQGVFKWSIANLADLNQVLGQHLAGQLSGALSLVPAGKGAAVASTNLQVSGEGLQTGTGNFAASLDAGTRSNAPVDPAGYPRSCILPAPAGVPESTAGSAPRGPALRRVGPGPGIQGCRNCQYPSAGQRRGAADRRTEIQRHPHGQWSVARLATYAGRAGAHSG